MTTELVLTPHEQQLTAHESAIMSLLPSCVNNTAFMAASRAAIMNSDLSKCTPASVIKAFYQCAQLGLMPGPLKHVHLIPYGGQCTVIPGYQGLMELARRSGRLGPIMVELAFVGEEFTYWNDEHGVHFRHVPDFKIRFAKDAQLHCGYCTVMIDGHPQPTVMPAEEIWAIQNKALDKAKGRSTPWTTDTDEMQKKTILRRASKLWPMTVEMATALELSARAEGGEPVTNIGNHPRINVTPDEPEELPPEKDGE